MNQFGPGEQGIFAKGLNIDAMLLARGGDQLGCTLAEHDVIH